MKITIAQLNPMVGDVQGNLKKILDVLSKCAKDSPDLLVFPELFLSGYPPRDLLEKKWFIENVQKAVDKIKEVSKKYPESGIIIGAPVPTGKNAGRGLYNSALLIHRGRILISQHKSLLPAYDVFDEARYFDPASEVNTVSFKGEVLGISVCEDMWNEPSLWPGQRYHLDPLETQAKKGATLFINLSASPFFAGKEEIRYQIIRNHAKKHNIPFIYVNQVGANDELIFDGRSMCIDKDGKPVKIFPSFKEKVQTLDTAVSGTPDVYTPQSKIESVYEALILGIKDYMNKCGFPKAIIGLSGGIDSSVTCCLAREALGSKNVLGISMPGPYSSQASIEDAKKLAENLGIRLKRISIPAIYSSYIESLKKEFRGSKPDVAEENIQARIRGNILMALSNKFGYLVLSTGNKSELAVGYCTLYGDMSGGLAVISDVPKTMVYELANYINKEKEIVPDRAIKKPPSAELRPNQKDRDSLPAYDKLDQILYYYVEEAFSVQEIINLGFDAKTVKWVTRAVDRNEYKRRQAVPGLKVTTKAFGIGRRMPIAAKYES